MPQKKTTSITELRVALGGESTVAQKESFFRNRVSNAVRTSKFHDSVHLGSALLAGELCDRLGLAHTEAESISIVFPGERPSDRAADILDQSQAFTEYLFRLQVLLDLLRSRRGWGAGARVLSTAIREALTDVGSGLNVKFSQKQLRLSYSGAAALEQGAVKDVLGVLQELRYEKVATAFNRALAYLTQGPHGQGSFQDAARSAQLALDEAAKIVLGNVDAGFVHLVKAKGLLDLDDSQRQILFFTEQWLNRKAKHNVVDWSRSDAEFAVYLAGAIIRRMFLRQ